MRKPISEPYRRLRNWKEAGNTLSVRKTVCYLFLRWAYSGKVDDRDQFIQAMRDWRKEEKRVGGHRTLLERKGRVLAKKNFKRESNANSRKAAKEWGDRAAKEGIGMLSPEWQARKGEIARERERRRKELGLPSKFAKHWIVHSPTGEVYYERGLVRICEEHGLDRRHLNATKRGNGKTHKGWWVELDNREFRDL